ncbi:carboxypeptidase-like regulatory domain-containing protein [Reichenbachiella ulvae]|uniref:Carboxypeptidase-like regulatory domain-containing protein n=1 Tax=Reichenbachiella ulvae TaxID=2980104 RepID=A0ABT3CQH0_9BACT|nr:carboxypeptidase-like regulatory domain-containing protein [Reichenbachiella ulvae]MCV9385793.1 carboxypeptidase-like regulatory domain-containing protein [Reichenbachiella ulvae]
MLKIFYPAILALGLATILFSCKDDDDKGPTEGVVTGTVLALDDARSVQGVSVSAFFADNNEPTGVSTTTNADGVYSINLMPGTYYLRLAKLGFQEVPPVGVTAIPFTIVEGETVTLDYDLVASAVIDGGAISGTVSSDSEMISGALIIATDATGSSYSAVSDAEGNYTILNVPAGTYTVQAWLSGYNGQSADGTVEANSITGDIDILMTAGVSATLDGSVKFLATGNKAVDVSLIHPSTQQVIPGLSVSTEGTFTMTDIPDGEYLARASYNNDTLVVDPDFIVKFGDPVVTVSGGAVTVTQGDATSGVLDFAVTNSVLLDNPSNTATEIVPVEVSAAGLTFTWKPYSSTSDYVVELLDINGNTIWGGFDNSGDIPVKVITTTSTSITYDGPALLNGRTYRWKVYASKDDKSNGGWSLISMSEDQMGLIKIIE